MPFGDLGTFSPIFEMINTISSMIIQTLMSFMPLHNCLNSLLSGNNMELLVNCSLDIATFIPIFTPFILTAKMIAPAARTLMMALGPFMSNLSEMMGGQIPSTWIKMNIETCLRGRNFDIGKQLVEIKNCIYWSFGNFPNVKIFFLFFLFICVIYFIAIWLNKNGLYMLILIKDSSAQAGEKRAKSFGFRKIGSSDNFLSLKFR